MERTFTITVSSNGAVSPTTIPKAGVSGEHKATTLNYSLAVPQSGIYKYNIEIQSGLGESYLSEFITPSDGATRVVSFSIPSAITRMGAADFCLIETKVDALGEIISITKSAMTRCIFTASPDSLDELEADYTGLLQGLISDVENIYDAIKELIANAGLYFNRPNFIFDTLADALAYDGDGYIIGSTVQTRGYYVAGDNGGALYEIKANDAPDGIFSYKINNDKMLSLVVANNEVCVDQLGAKGDVDLGSFSYWGDDASWEDIIAYNAAIVAAEHTDDTAIIQAAVDNPLVRKINFSDKVYATTDSINITGEKILSGGTIKSVIDTSTSGEKDVIVINRADNVTIENMTIINSVCRIGCYAHCLYIFHSNNAVIKGCTFHDSWGESIKTQGTLTDGVPVDCNNLLIDNCIISRTRAGIYFSHGMDGVISNTTIDSRWNKIVYGGGVYKTNHCIYAGALCKNYIYSNLVLRGAGDGWAVKRQDNTALYQNENIQFNNIVVDDCRGFAVFGWTQGLSVSNVTATNIRCAFYISKAIDFAISNCVFEGKDFEDFSDLDSAVMFGDTYGNTGVISNCIFNFDRRMMYKTGRICAITEKNKFLDNIQFNGCRFIIRRAGCGTMGSAPFMIMSDHREMVFSNCDFEILDYIKADEDSTWRTDGVLFVFFLGATNLLDDFKFISCNFKNLVVVGEETMTNSVVCVYNSGGSDSMSLKNLRITFYNCIFQNFCICLRGSRIKATQASALNPAYAIAPMEAGWEAAWASFVAALDTERFSEYRCLYDIHGKTTLYMQQPNAGFGVTTITDPTS